MVSDMTVFAVTWRTLQRERPLMKTLGRRTLSDAVFMNGKVPTVLGIQNCFNMTFLRDALLRVRHSELFSVCPIEESFRVLFILNMLQLSLSVASVGLVEMLR